MSLRARAVRPHTASGFDDPHRGETLEPPPNERCEREPPPVIGHLDVAQCPRLHCSFRPWRTLDAVKALYKLLDLELAVHFYARYEKRAPTCCRWSACEALGELSNPSTGWRAAGRVQCCRPKARDRFSYVPTGGLQRSGTTASISAMRVRITSTVELSG